MSLLFLTFYLRKGVGVSALSYSKSFPIVKESAKLQHVCRVANESGHVCVFLFEERRGCLCSFALFEERRGCLCSFAALLLDTPVIL